MTKHGISAYRRGCRCDTCRAANAAAEKRRRTARVARLAANPDWDTVPHGATTGYTNYGCRCDTCRAAKADYQRDYRQRRRAGGAS